MSSMNLDKSKIFLFGKKVNMFTCLQQNCFENTVGKAEINLNEQFLLFPTVFATLMENSLPFSTNLKMSSATP